MGIRNSIKAVLFFLVMTTTIAGCANSLTIQPDSTTSGDNNSPDPSATVEQPDIIEQRPSQTLPGGLERVETPEFEPVVGEVPDEILDEIIDDLMKSTGAEREDVQVVRAEAVLWNDGALGCPKPGEFYIQILINGYWVVLEVEGVEYDYRVSDKGNFALCEGENMPPINPSDTGDQTQNPLVSQAKEDLSARLGIPITDIELLSFEEVVWPDSSLGCPQPGMRYLQVPSDGALIRLSAEGQVYDYHSGSNRGVFLCEKAYKDLKKPTPIDLTKLTPPAPDNSIPPGEDQ